MTRARGPTILAATALAALHLPIVAADPLRSVTAAEVRSHARTYREQHEPEILGHSFGGYLAIAYTSKYPQQVRGLVFVDSAAPKLGDVTQLMDQVFPDRIGEWRAKRATLGRHVQAADVVVFQSMEFVDEVALREFLDFVKDHASNMDVNNALRKDMAGRDYWDDVERFKQPALVVHGRFDVIVAPSDSWKLHQALPNSRFYVIEAAGHLPHIERPDAFLAAVQPFLEALDR